MMPMIYWGVYFSKCIRTAMKKSAPLHRGYGGLMSIVEWIDQTLAAKGYIQAQEDREDFVIATGVSRWKFNKWMRKAGLRFNKQTGQWQKGWWGAEDSPPEEQEAPEGSV